jgi:uroporphyrinogen-III synthase
MAETVSPLPTDKVPIYLLKTKSVPEDGYETYFRNAKYDPIFVPVLEHQPVKKGIKYVRKALLQDRVSPMAQAPLYVEEEEDDMSYGGMIFTSQRAVEAFAKLLSEEPFTEHGKVQVQLYLSGVPIYTVGPATSRALRSIPGLEPSLIFGEDSGNGAALSRQILRFYKSTFYPQHEKPPALLFCVGEARRDVIPRTLMDPTLGESERIYVKEVELYRTGVMKSFYEDFRSELVKAPGTREQPRWVVVFSPTGCEDALKALGLLDPVTKKARKLTEEKRKRRTTYIATIGPTTRDYLKQELGFESDVCAPRPSPEGVGEAILQFMVESQDRRKAEWESVDI